MRLGIEQFKLIKPDGAQDDYTSGQDARGNTHMSNIEKGKIYREMIVAFISKRGYATVKCVTDELDISLKVVASIIQKLNNQGCIKKDGKIVGKSNRSSFKYVLANKLI